ncbi:MAG: hypothetical protein COB14_01435 [Alphaproteobacteria bacterium]|nr:MAG: hypothetical protein COB14_01435 [Alphaproteobacteria bacterium]
MPAFVCAFTRKIVIFYGFYMFKKQKHIGIKFCLALYTAGIFFVPTSGFAKDNARPAPLHIKINNPKSPSSKKSFNIRVGKMPAKNTTKKTTEIDITPEPKTSTLPAPTKNITPKLIETRSCHENTSKNKKRYKNLADSLKLYLTTQNRNPSLINDIYDASITTQTDFELLLITAMIESDLGRVTKSSTSSARGIFQYIEPTWLILIKRYGVRIGKKTYADTIEINTESYLPEMIRHSQFTKKDVLDLRNNTKIASLIKAYQLKDEAKIVAKYKAGQRINATDHYIVHMLGLSQARTFYALLRNESSNILTNLNNKGFKEAIRLNPTFFYSAQNKALGATEAYTQFHRKVSQQYKRLHDISKKYGNSDMPRSRCNLPKIQTVSAIKTTKDHRL